MRILELTETSSAVVGFYCLSRSCCSLSSGKLRDATLFMAMAAFFAFQFYLINSLSYEAEPLSEREISIQTPSLRGLLPPPSKGFPQFPDISEMQF